MNPLTTETQLKNLFAAFGSVESATVVKDRDTHGPRGFAFIEMTSAAEARAAIESLNGFPLNDQAMVLNEARPKTVHDPRGNSSRKHRRHKI